MMDSKAKPRRSDAIHGLSSEESRCDPLTPHAYSKLKQKNIAFSDTIRKNNHIDDVVISWHTSISEAIAALAPMVVILPIKSLGVMTTERRGRDGAKLVVSDVSLGGGGAADVCC
jgi:hypothetical protein